MSNIDQRMHDQDTHDQSEPLGPADESGLVGEPRSPNNTGLVGAPTEPDNSGLVGSEQINATDTGVYGTGTGGDYSGQNSAELPDQQLLQPGYNPQVGTAGRLQDLERGGPNPGGYSGAPGQPGFPDQAGTLDQTIYASRDNESAPAGPDADMRPNNTDSQTGY